MFIPITRILLCLVLCLLLFSSLGCPSNSCIEYQDVAGVDLLGYVGYGESRHIDSVAMKVNDSITGCGNPRYKMVVGSKAHRIKFPINVRIQLFAQGDLWEELSLKMDKNTVLKVYNRYECTSLSTSPLNFLNSVEDAKKHNRFIDSSLTDDYCWLLEKMDKTIYNDDLRCTEWAIGSENELCGRTYINVIADYSIGINRTNASRVFVIFLTGLSISTTTLLTATTASSSWLASVADRV
jgi:hypothetical protein